MRPAQRLRDLRRESQWFAIGSACFALAALPGLAHLVGEEADNVVYVIGAAFFTIAAFVQLCLTGRWRPGAWRSGPDWDDWWAAAIQFAGTLCFNVTTIAALHTQFTAQQADDRVWRPDAVGSACFLISSALAVLATTHRDGLWDPLARNWTSSWLNMAGSVAFGASAIASYVVGSTDQPVDAALVASGTFVGALCFLVAALLVEPPAPDAAGRPHKRRIWSRARAG